MTKTNFITTLFILVLSTALFSQGTIPNQDFEEWDSNYSAKHWESTTDMIPPGYITCNKTSESYSGDYAIQLKTISLESFTVPGVITLGTLGMGYTEGGVEFSDRPESMKGFFKHPSSGDLVQVIVQFYKNGIETGGGYWSTTDSIADYTEFTVPISFQTSENPDMLNITILTDQNIVGSTLLLDDLQFEYPTTAIPQNRSEEALRVYPNPCSTQLLMDLPFEEAFDMAIYRLNGELIKRESDKTAPTINTSDLASGAYGLILTTSHGRFSQKFIKQ